jgi:hypothetical protein
MREYDKIASVVPRRNLSGLYVVFVCSMEFPAFLNVANGLAKDRNLPQLKKTPTLTLEGRESFTTQNFKRPGRLLLRARMLYQSLIYFLFQWYCGGRLVA